MSQQKKLRSGITILVVLALAVIVVITAFASFIIDYLWFSALDYTGPFWTMRLAWVQYCLVFSILGFILLFGNFYAAARLSRKEGRALEAEPVIPIDLGEYTEPFKQFASGGLKRLNWLFGIVAAVLAVLAGLAMAPQWEQFLRYFNQVPFGEADPLFGHDIGFYLFSLPVHRLFRGWLMSLVIFSVLGSAIIYWINGMFKVVERSVSFSQTVKTHLYSLITVGLLLKAWDYRLQMYDLLYVRTGLVFGAEFTDFHIHRVALWVLLIYMLALAIFTVSGIFSAKDRVVLLVIALVITLPLIAVVRGVIPGLVQQMIVKPNELEKERRFLEYNIAMTNNAYGLQDIVVKQFPAENSLTLQDVQNNEDTINNIRLWDSRPLLSTYQQIQAIRPYYIFHNVDVDRYMIDGKKRQVMLAPRELERSKLPAQTWVNTRLTFTHGYGVVMNPVNSLTPEGLPELFIKDIPPISPAAFSLENTAIYYGEHFAGTQAPRPTAPGSPGAARPAISGDYVIVKTDNEEFDYPTGEENKTVIYEGTGGVRMGSLFRRALFAWGFRDVNIFLTGATTKESRIMFRRNIQERIRHIAPFLELDTDPYIVLSQGRLFWIQDAYTFSNQYPYSDPVLYKRKTINYIRNSIKIVVDAYNGNIDFYLFDETDPLAKTYQNIFPDLFKEFEEMPDDLKAHIRYPRNLFSIQMLQYNTYHMKDGTVFYNKEDLWTIPNENYAGETIKMEPYYIQMRLPGESTQEFILMNPLTPNNKDNMIAWLAARCDGEHYGELLVYRFPKDKLIYGPSQIEARIDQNTLISQQFSLWDQRGSNIIRGNLLVIPIEDSILYVEPVYLKAEQRELPELKRVIASYSGNVVMGMNLKEALEAAFGGKLTVVEQELVEQVPVESLEEAELAEVIQRLADHFTTARQHLAEGNWAKYGEEMDKAEDVIQMLQQQYGTQE